MALASIRWPATVLRKPGAWIGLWGALQGTPSSYRLCASWNRHAHLCSTKLNASNYQRLFHNVFSRRLPELSVSPDYIVPFTTRLKSNISSKNSTEKTVEDEDSEEEREHGELSEQEDELEGEPGVVRDYRDLEKVVQSLRYDAILKTGLDVGRNRVEEAFYKGELRLNGEKLWKKSRTVKVGDTLDLLIGEDKEGEKETVMRILLKKVFEEKTAGEKHRVVVRRWKRLELPKKRVSK
ncbi:mitochondrial transcription rescue factor 1 isoform X1 [Echinops telfairi]|uniref:Mitochondrial transcription rescue factor 1 isoform X1 n=2 Tax=Echinops telfairi TaxID=9371 RepID=A0ABM0IBH1_ECHTE|nr:mitochondrial transcription rescue factor 1 isoform X1 [Echinops telfairi]XP_045150401.1 mitochondrial transcription rescue factor 1 isoform X1 [Echinops telfairi]